MIIEAIAASILVALASLTGALLFGNSAKIRAAEAFLIPLTVGVFLSLVLYELIPETLLAAPDWGGVAVALGFIGFFLLSSLLHNHFHKKMDEADCDKKSSANLVLIGDAVHNLADGVILGTAFLVDPAVGIAVAIGLALHEIPQEIVEFGILIRAGYSRLEAALRNLLSASSIVVGTLLIILISEHAAEYVWILTGIAAGNLLYLAASDLLPRVHNASREQSQIYKALFTILVGFIVMTSVITWTHSTFGDGHAHDEHDHSEEHHEHEDESHNHEHEAEHHDDLHHEDETTHEEPLVQ